MYALGIIRYHRSLEEIAQVTKEHRGYQKDNLMQYELLPWNVMGGREDLDKI